MKRPFLISLLCCLLPLTASAQEKDSFFRDLNDFLNMRENKSYAKLDSNYIGRYPYHWDARLFAKSTGLNIVLDGNGSGHLTTGMSTRAGVGLSYRGVGLSYSRAIGRPIDIDLSFDSYGKHFGFEYAFRVSNDLKGEIAFPYLPPLETNENVVLFSNKLNLFYNFNSRFSYAAAIKQTMIQRRSAGSFIIGASWWIWDIMQLQDDENALSAQNNWVFEIYQSNLWYNRISIGAGYGYNLVLGREHWLLHASAIPMWTVYESATLRTENQRLVTRYPYGLVSFTGSARAGVYYRWGTRWSLGFSGVGNLMVSKNNHDLVGKQYDRFLAQEWQMTLSLGVRF